MTMSGVYTSRGNFDFDRNVVGWFSPFQPGDVISWSFTTSGTSPYVHIQLANELNTPYPSSALNRTGSGSGSFTVQTATDYVNISAMPLQLDANGDVINSSDNPAMYNRTATITVSCTPAGSATPTVTSLSPTTGSVLGGTTVTLTGTNLTGITNVSFGGTAATDITGNTATSVTVRTPAHAAGAVNVVATASAGSTTVTNGFTYAKAAQTITFADPGAQNFGAAPTLTASASSGLALAFTSATTGVCTISSAGVLTFVTVGTCTINADQAGDATYQAATTVSRSFAVNAVAPGAPTIGTATAGDGQATLTFTAPTSTGGATITGYEVTISPGNTVVTGASSPITIPNLTNGTAYSFTVKAINSAGSGPASAASNTVTPVGPLAPPTVGAVTATVNANSSGNAITLVLSGGAATSVAVASAPRNGTATASGTSITYTPMTNYRGSDSFTYTATNASGTSAPATVTIDVAGQPAVITSHPQDVRTTVGGSATFSVSATNAASYWWQAHPPQQSTFGNIAASSQYHTVANAPTLALSGVPALFNGYVFRLAVTGTDGQTVYSNSATLQVSAAPVVTSVTPAAGPTSGGTAITITGQYFTGATAVTIGGNPVTSFSVVSATSITAVVPAGNVGPADVVVINPDGTGTKTGAFTYQAPAVVMSPAAGALPGAVVGTAFSQTVSASGGTAPFTYAVTTGTLPAGLSLDPATGAIVGTPTVAGSYSFTVTATDAANQTASAAYTLAVAVQAPVAGAVSTTVAANSTAHAVTLALSGGTATSVAIVTAPAHGTATASGTGIVYTPTAGYSGSDSFTYTATNASGTSAPATVTITVNAPTLVVAPASGPLPAATVGTAYGATLTSTGGTAPYGYSATGLPAGITLAADGTLSGTPTTAGSYTVTVAVTDANGAIGTATYTLEVSVQAPVAGAVSTTVAANSTANAVTLALSGGTATSVAVVTAPTHGTATVSGTGISYTPSAGYSGSDSFTYTATNASGTSAPATVTVTVTAPTLVVAPASGPLPAATVGTAYTATLTSSGGTAPYGYTATGLPAGVTLASNGTLSGTPTTAGSYTVTVAVTDVSGATGTATYTLTVAVQAPVAGAVSTTVVANSTANAVTLALSGGAATSVAVATTPAHGTATVSGTDISYTPSAGYSGSDSFTYTATNASGTSAPATVTVTVTAPTLVVAPASGPLPAATVGTAYGATLTSTGGTAPYGYSATGLPAGITLAADGTLSGTPTTAGSYTVTVAVTDANGAIGTATYTLEVSVQAPVAGAVSTTVAANSTANAVTLALSGGTATSVAVVTAPTHGTATVSGTGISYTPSAGYSGSDSFTYTATNASGTSAPATVTVTVTAPTLVVAPASGPLPAATVGTAYTATLTSSGGTAPYGYTATGLPAGVTLASNGTLSGTPTTAGSYTVTVAVTDVSGATGTATYTLTVAVQAPVAGAVSTTVVANSTANAVTLALSGGAATSVAVATTPAHGTATVSGTDISYTPSAGYSGSDSFTYTATNASGTSAPATVTVTVTAPTLVVSPASGPLPSATVGTAYSTTLASTGGTAPYGYSATDLPAAITLAADGTLSGTPTTAGNYTVTIAVTDANGATGTATYTLAVNPPPPPVAADPVTTSVAANTQTEAGKSVSLNLSSLVTGQFDDIRIVTQPAHGTVTISRTLAMRGIGGSPLMAMAIAMSSVSVPGQIIAVYTPEAGYQGTDTFQYVAVGPGGTSAPATATIQVVGTAPTAKAITASATDGQPISVDLTAAASGGAFTAATVTSVSPADQATATIVAGGTAEARTFLLKVTPKARFNGMIEVGYTIANVFGTSAPAMVTINVTARPDPSQDAKVGAMSDAQAEAARRFSRAQVANFMSHAEALHGAECGRSTNGLRLGSTDMPSTSHMPGQPIERSLSERDRRRASAGETSEQDERRNEGREVAAAGCSGRVGVWSGGTIDIGTRDATTGRSKVSATTSGISAGVDLHVAKGLTLGIGGGLGHDRSTIAGGAGKVNSDSQVVAIYGSATPMQGWFVDGMLAHGWLDYSLRRLDEGAGALATADRSGSFSTGALSSGIDRSTGALRWSVYGRAEYLNGRLNRYIEEGAGIYNLRFDDRDLRSVTGALGVRLAWQRPLPFGVLTGRLRTEWLHEFTSGTRQGLDYADVAGPSYYSLLASGWSREQFMVAPGIGLTLSSGWDVGLDVGVRAADGERAATTGVQVRKKF